MAGPRVPGANLTSITESSRKLIYPTDEDLRSKIPLWLKFYCYEYTNTAEGRARAYSRSSSQSSGVRAVASAILGLDGKEKAQILLPAPVNFDSVTSHNYQAQPTAGLNLFSTAASGMFDFFRRTAVPDGLKDAFNAIATRVDNAAASANNFLAQWSGWQSDMPADTMDSMYMSTGPSRTFEIKMNLPCLTEEDSKAAGEIVRAFEALSLPTARSPTFNTTLNVVQQFHPPLWIFGIGSIDSYKFDPDWTGYPQLCVLRTVRNKKTAFETNSLAALGHNGLLKPVAYTLTLQFIELEPAFRVTGFAQDTNFNITNRSGIRSNLVNGVANIIGEVGTPSGGNTTTNVNE